jgi:hypothetical protein
LSRPELEEALLLLRKAQEDADAVKKLVPDTDIADSVVGFHAQQAAEKALKAVLAASGDDFPWTHDLRHLMDRLQTAGTPLPASLREVRVLIPWAVARTQPLDSLRAKRCTSRRSTVVCGWTDHPAPNRSSWSFRIRGHGDFENFPAIPVFRRVYSVVRTTVGAARRGSAMS